MSNYIIELTAIHFALMFGYWFFLRKESQYAKMRFYLIGSTILALVIPLIKLPKLFYSSPQVNNLAMPLGTTPLDVVRISPAAHTSIGYSEILIGIYIAISVFFLIKLVKIFVQLFQLEGKCEYQKFNDLYIRKVSNINGSFTFFNWIFLSDEIDETHKDFDPILKHEKAHVTLGHTYDLMFLELFKICFWWLPTTWYILKEIKIIHEYQADAYALKTCKIDQYSSILIGSTLNRHGMGLASSFYDGLILKRLTAMKQKQKKVNPWKMGTLALLSVMLFIGFACTEEPNLAAPQISSESNDISSEKIEEMYPILENWARYPGGIQTFYKDVAKNIKYPEEALNSGIEGRVWVEFTVTKDGSLSDVKVLKGIGGGCDEEAVKAVQNLPDFEPARQRGKAVNVRNVFHVTYKIDSEGTSDDGLPGGSVILDEFSMIHHNLKVDAQYADGKWSGIVYDENGYELPGANVIVHGTPSSTVSDEHGAFEIKADESQSLVVRFVGYENSILETKSTVR